MPYFMASLPECNPHKNLAKPFHGTFSRKRHNGRFIVILCQEWTGDEDRNTVSLLCPPFALIHTR